MEALNTLALFEQFTEKVPYGVTINALDGRYIHVNGSFCDICEYSSDELMNMSFKDVTHPEDVEPNIELDRKLKDGDIPYFQMAKRYITKSGQQKHVLLQVSLIRNDDESPKYYYAQVIDVTDLGHLLEERTIGNDYLDLVLDIPIEQRHSNITYEVLRLYRQQNMRKATHLGNIAHELKNPLNGVKGFANLMRKNYERGEFEKADAFYEKFTQSCVFLEHMVNELLDLTYIETGHLKPKKSQFNVIQLVNTVIDSMTAMAHQHGLALNVSLPTEEEILIESDHERLWEIISNLISNGIKYTEEGHVDLTLSCDEHNLTIEVSDTGIGIDSGDLGAIFDEYQKVHKTLKKEVDSTGLGLPITRRLVKMLGGEIFVESEVGKGSRFTFTLPMSN